MNITGKVTEWSFGVRLVSPKLLKIVSSAPDDDKNCHFGIAILVQRKSLKINTITNVSLFGTKNEAHTKLLIDE